MVRGAEQVRALSKLVYVDWCKMSGDVFFVCVRVCVRVMLLLLRVLRENYVDQCYLHTIIKYTDDNQVYTVA